MNDNELNRYRELYNAALQFIVCKQKNKCLGTYLLNRGYKSASVYGMNDLGNRIYYDISMETNLYVPYVIDMGMPKLYYDIKCIRLNEMNALGDVDVIVVALPYLYDDVRREIMRFSNAEIISVSQLVYDVVWDNGDI